ncbi:DUF4136 domain-containing protein [Sphingorhabdus arenilitoris]|uniref:DUF4136 domain-containing protein n=1 Tax=Sphingorhabdus arenilitoris TaxID=1490041 RepID=A0ABV8RJL3_9SPHN
MAKVRNIIRKTALMAAPLALLTLSGCATPFRAEVSRFQQLPETQGQSFAIAPADPKNEGGIEFDQYASLVAAKMSELGYVPAADRANADLTVSLDYGVDDGKERRVLRADPFYDPFWGYGRAGFFGYRGFYRPVGFRGRHGRRYVYGFYDPFLFGGYGFNGGYDVESFTVYTGDIDMKITRNSDGKSLFEGKAEAKSRSNKLPYLVPNLIEAMFTGFPGNSGEVVRISVAPEPKGKK